MKILVVRFSSIGDIVLTSPVVRCIRQQLNAEVHYITKKAFASQVENNPFVSKVITIDNKVSEVEGVLREERYDVVIDLHHNLRSMQVKRVCNTKSYSFPKLNVQKWLLVNTGIDLMPPVHIVDRYFKTVEALGVKNDRKGLDYFIPEKDEVDISLFPESHRTGYDAVTVGAKFATKEMPAEMMIEVILRRNRPVVLLGGKDEVKKAEQIVGACGSLVHDLAGKLNLNQSASVLKQAQLVIAHDTGMMHIASALKKNIYSVWGNTVPQLGMYPYLPGDGSRIIEVKGLRCRPCSKIGYSKCPQGHFQCMKRIPLSAFD